MENLKKNERFNNKEKIPHLATTQTNTFEMVKIN
jgi:hypothetical protein